MTSIENALQVELTQANYDVGVLEANDISAIIFENDEIIGFAIVYSSPSQLMSNWRTDSERILAASQFALRRAGEKAWNTYFIYLSAGEPTYADRIALNAVEEDLVGTRKIARSIENVESEVRAAVLSLLRIQHAPELEPVDMSEEIRRRVTELPSSVVDVFLSNADDSVVNQLLGDQA